MNTTGSGDVGQACGQAGGERVQNVFDRGGTVVPADEDGRVVRVEVEAAFVGSLFADAEEAVDGAAAVGTVDPFVAGSELELRRFGRGLDRVECGEEGGGVDAVARRLVEC